jgi:quinohemoprotein ethanol dehydrogenase
MIYQRGTVASILAASLVLLLQVGAVWGAGPEGRDTPTNWPGHGNGPDQSGYSRLEQIHRGNVRKLGLVWSLNLPGEEMLEATPIEVDGTLYFTGSKADVYAVDALSGKLLWKHAAEVWKHHPQKMLYIFPANRGCAYDSGKIFSATTDGRLLALNAKSGALLWSVETVDGASPETVTGAPLTFDGKVMIGHGGGDIGVRGHVTAYDQETGRQLWKFYAVPGSPQDNAGNPAMERAAKTWSGEYWKTGTGGAPWDGLTYDPELKQVYVGTGNAGPYDPAKRSPGNGDNLYLTSIVALDADTGEYIWHYQESPREGWDYKASANMIAATLNLDGHEQKVLMQQPTNGFYYVLDRATGKLLSAQKVGKVTWADHIDLATGRPVERSNIRYETGETVMWPGTLGSHNWQPMSFNPGTGLTYIPYMQYGTRYTRAPDTFLGVAMRPVYEDERDGKGALVAWDPVAQKERWRVNHDWLWNGGTLTTAGNLVFQGTADGWFTAYDAATGQRLWRFYAGLGIISQPITYSVGNTQYVALLVGYGFPNISSAPTTNPGWKFNAQPRRLLVFKLGGAAKLPPGAPPNRTVNALDDPALVLDPAQVDAGRLLYAYCAGCHGTGVVSSGAPAPDLRESQVAFNPDALYSVLHAGTFLPSGMAPFDHLTPEQAHQIYAYIRDRARAVLRGDTQDVRAGESGLH